MSKSLAAEGSVDDPTLASSAFSVSLGGRPPSSGSEPVERKPGEAVKPSDLMSVDDYKRLSRRTQEKGTATGIVGGGFLTFLARQYLPTRPSKNALFLTFFLSSTCISYFTSHHLLLSRIGALRAEALALSTPEGGPILQDRGDPPTLAELHRQARIARGPVEADREAELAKDEAERRKRYWKGRGLSGEVEEEDELRDVYLRAGTPRK